LTVGNLDANILTVGNLDVGILTVGNLDVDILTVGNLDVNILTVGNLDVGILTVGNLDVGILTVGNLKVGNSTSHLRRSYNVALIFIGGPGDVFKKMVDMSTFFNCPLPPAAGANPTTCLKLQRRRFISRNRYFCFKNALGCCCGVKFYNTGVATHNCMYVGLDPGVDFYTCTNQHNLSDKD
jgi:hypothetical protein